MHMECRLTGITGSIQRMQSTVRSRAACMIKSIIAVFTVVVGLAATSQSVEAYTYTYNDDKAGLIIVGDRLVHAAIGNLFGLVTGRLSEVTNAMRHMASGEPSRAAGNASSVADGQFHAWVASGATFFENDDTGITADFDGDVIHVAGGVDAVIHGRTLVGLGAAFEYSNVDTDFNLGQLEGHGLLVFPYFSHVFNTIFSIDGHVGYGMIDYDMDRMFGTITGSTNADRFFLAVTGHAEAEWNDIIFGGAVGFDYATEHQDAFIESDGTGVASQTIDLGQVDLTGRVTYDHETANGFVRPFVFASLEYDVISERGAVLNATGARGERDDLGAVFGGGLDVQLNDTVRFTLEGQIDPFRGSFESYGVTGKLRISLDSLFD